MFDFLKQVQATVPEKAPRAAAPRKQRNPEQADLRVFYDGSVYPSKELVTRFNLEYGRKPAEKEDPTGNGFDIIDSAEFGSYLVLPAGARCLWISPVSRSENKLDLFASCTFEEDGSPKTSVLDQGSVTFGKETLLPLLEQVYGITLDKEGKRYVDLQLVGNGDDAKPWVLPGERTVAFVPKSVARGEKKGTPTVQRREHPRFWALVPAAVQETAQHEDEALIAEEATA